MNEATRAQIAAADPDRSTWLSANAGSGKTRVLTDRVARLLMRGVAPQRILCLTYTKAAASEMQNRLFSRLGGWSMMPDAKLREALCDLGVTEAVDVATLAEARRLFAKAIETPGGLKIQTIHAFCGSLLRRFPLEAGVAPGFGELDARGAKELRAEVLEELAREAPEVMAEFALEYRGAEIESLLAAISGAAEQFDAGLSDADLRALNGVPPNETPQAILADVFLGAEPQIARDALPYLQAHPGSNNDKLASFLSGLDAVPSALAALPRFEAALLTKSGNAPYAPTAQPPTKPAAADMGALAEEIAALKSRVAAARPRRLAWANYRRDAALHRFASEFLPRILAHKRSRAVLDFDDLIARARDLLRDPGVAAWVLYRLDGGIDHILVDEAQDTSPTQWDVIRLITEEFTAGQSARSDTERTIFVVGDPKQSIYSFQGADPEGFERMRRHFGTALQRVGQGLADRALLHSFRSAPAILRTVDAVFSQVAQSGMGPDAQHMAFRSDLPGRVDLWSWEMPGKKQDDKPWWDPTDTLGETHHYKRLADRIARFIADRLARGRIQTASGKIRPIRPRDFLVLVQKRSALFHEIIRACKQAGLAMAGTDRLRIGADLAVRDLKALLSYLATPEDDLALACVLRSPLGDLDEAALYDLAQGREGFLRAQLEAARERHPDVWSMLRDLRDRADYLRPYELLERCLTDHGGRNRLVARLGTEVEEGISALLSQALAYEQGAIPSVTGFLDWLERDEVEVKRSIDESSDEIRVMTVHGAKGLEAPIVILPDTLISTAQNRAEILPEGPRWKSTASERGALQAEAVAAQAAREAAERQRLLYVAMTRAESWLIIAGAGAERSREAESWHLQIGDALQQLGAATPAEPGVLLRHANGIWPADAENRDVSGAALPALPDWVGTPPPEPPETPVPRRPSDLGGAKALYDPVAGLDEEAALARGTMIHRLLDILADIPAATRKSVAARVLDGFDPGTGEDLGAMVIGLLEQPDLAWIFAPGSLSEVAISARPEDLGPLFGAIDRLIVTPERVTAIDFKSNAAIPARPEEVPLGLLRQMDAYAAALAQLYPDRQIDTAILWTSTAQLMPLPHEIVRSSRNPLPNLDAGSGPA